MINYQWQGTPCTVRFGYVVQQENTEKPLYWYNFECCTHEQLDGSFKHEHMCFANGKHFSCIPAIEVTQGNQTFKLANHYGIGINKLIKGGWPNHNHFSLDGPFTEDDPSHWVYKELELDEYERHESARRDWQRKTHPEDFAKMEAFRESMRNSFKHLGIRL